MTAALLQWWDSRTDAERGQWTGVFATIALLGIHLVLWSPWVVEDAAISYAFARHASGGEGWVAWPGGERVEGFSNPTWTALLTAFDFLGPNPWAMGKLLGLFFGALTLPLAFLWARELTGERGLIPVLAPLLLAVSPQFAVWCAAGLENSLFTFLMALGCWRLLLEMRDERTPWSLLPMGLLGITRPEAPLYVATAAFVYALITATRRPRKLWWVAAWAAGTAVPWFAYEAYRLAVFAYPLPNTYYAKLFLDVDKFQPFAWSGGHGWSYLRNWALWSGFGFLIPLLPPVVTGRNGWRGALAVIVAGFVAVMLISGVHWGQHVPYWPFWPDRPEWGHIRIASLFFLGLGLPLIGLGQPRDHARLLAWYLAATACFFVLYAGPDWMDGFRWLNMGFVPIAVILTDLVRTLRDVLLSRTQRFAGRIAWTVGAVPLVAGVIHTGEMLSGTETSPFDVHRRVIYMEQVQQRLHLDHVVNMEVDFGAQMWWSGDELVDMAGLMDVPIAHHSWQRPFMTEYVFQERVPHFAHAHGGWKSRAGLAAIPEFRREYIEIPHFPAGRRNMHVGNLIRRDTFLSPDWPYDRQRTARFGQKIALSGLDTPAPTVFPGGTMHVRIGFKVERRPAVHFRALLALTRGDVVHTWELPPAYDWLMPNRWAIQEIAIGRHTLPLPDTLEPGSWDLRLVVLNDTGVLAADDPARSPVLAAGEAEWLGVIEVAPLEDVVQQAEGHRDQVVRLALEGQCTQASELRDRTRHHLPPTHRRQWANSSEVMLALARCWAREAEVRKDADAIALARRHGRHDPEVSRIAAGLADHWVTEAEQAVAEGDTSGAYQSLRRALLADPQRAGLRKRAEELRDKRLDLNQPAAAPDEASTP